MYPLISICFLFFFCSSLTLFASLISSIFFSNPFFFASMRQLVLNYETSLVRVMNDPKRKSGGRPLKDASHTINQQGSFLSSMCRGYTRSNALCACLFVSMLNWWRVVSIVNKRLSVFYTVARNYHFSRIIFPSFYEIYIYNLYLFNHYTLFIPYRVLIQIRVLLKIYLRNNLFDNKCRIDQVIVLIWSVATILDNFCLDKRDINR